MPAALNAASACGWMVSTATQIWQPPCFRPTRVLTTSSRVSLIAASITRIRQAESGLT